MENEHELNTVNGVGEDLQEESAGSVSSVDLRNASYFILFIAAVFVVNAMETGSYRTPWPVAIIVSLIGLGLYGYSFMKGRRDPDPS